MSIIEEYKKIENLTKQKIKENPDYQMTKEEIKAHVFVSRNNEEVIENNNQNYYANSNEENIDQGNNYISNEDIEAELQVMNARVNDIDGLKKQIEKFYENPESIDMISNQAEKDFYEKMVQIYAENKDKELTKTKSETLTLNFTNKEAGFISLIYVSTLLLFLTFLFFALF